MDRKWRLLIVDDEEGFTKILQLNLEATGDYEVRTENDASRALEAAKEFRPDLIVLDIIMPGTDGGEIAARMREDPELRDIPFVFLTAIISKRELHGETNVIRGSTFIAKPVRHDTLIQVIQEHLPTPPPS